MQFAAGKTANLSRSNLKVGSVQAPVQAYSRDQKIPRCYLAFQNGEVFLDSE